MYKTIEEFPKYEISTTGDVRNKETGRILKPRLDKDGYLRISLKDENGKLKTRFIHRLVAITYIPNPLNKPQVNHKDFNRQNPSVENLEWVTAKENKEWSWLYNREAQYKSKAGGWRCIMITPEGTEEEYESAKKAAAALGYGVDNIRRACSQGTKYHGCYWRWEK